MAGSALQTVVRASRLAFLALVVLLFDPHRASAQAEALTAGSLRVVHAPRHRGLAREVMAVARTPLRLPGMGAVALPESTTIVLAPDAAAFRAATGGGAPEWAGGVAIPGLRRIVLPAYPVPGTANDDRATVLRHEVAHLVLHQRLPEPIPRWFDEGFAEVASGGWDVESAWQLRVAFVTGAAPPLDSLVLDWPTAESDARLAYLLSATAVDYLRRRGGEEGLALFFANWRREGAMEPALRTTYGITFGHFEDEWRRDVRTRYGWLWMLTSVTLVWLLATGLVLVAWYPRRRRNRRRLASMEAEERMLPPPRPELAGVEYPLAEPPDEWAEDVGGVDDFPRRN